VATFGIFLPSFLVLIATVPYYDRLSSSIWFNRAVEGIFCSFVGLLASATFHFAQDVPWDMPRALLALAALAALLKKVDILWVVLVGIVISVLAL
jgi:chromate transporter